MAVRPVLAAARSGRSLPCPAARPSMDQPRTGPIQKRRRGHERRLGRGVDDAMLGAGNVQAVGQRLAAELVVDQGGDHADLGQPVPERQIVQAIGQQDRHRRAARQPLAARPMGAAVGHLVERAIGEGLALEADRRAFAPAIRRPLQIVADEVGRARRDRAHPEERADQAGQIAALAPQNGQWSHSRARPRQSM